MEATITKNKEKTEDTIGVLKELTDLLTPTEENFNKVKAKTKELSDLLAPFETKTIAELVTNPPRDGSPLSILILHYDQSPYDLARLKKYFNLVKNENHSELDIMELYLYHQLFVDILEVYKRYKQ